MAKNSEIQERLSKLQTLFQQIAVEINEISKLIQHDDPSPVASSTTSPEPARGEEARPSASAPVVAHPVMRHDAQVLYVQKRRIRQTLADAYPETAVYWHPDKNGEVTPSMVTKTATTKYWWRCPTCGAEWESSVLNQTMKKHPCRTCSNSARPQRTIVRVARSAPETLASLYPNVAREWHRELNDGLTPETTSPNSHKRAWWLCSSCGNVFQARVVNRTIGSRCPECFHLTTG